jgi:hypothetical protein
MNRDDLLAFAKQSGYNMLGSSKSRPASAAGRAHRTNRTFNTGLACLKFRFVSSPPSGNSGSSTLPHNACPASLKRWRDFVRTQCLPVHINSLKLCRQRKSMDCDGGDTVMTKSKNCQMNHASYMPYTFLFLVWPYVSERFDGPTVGTPGAAFAA